MEFEVLISTHLSDQSRINDLNITTDAIVINQCGMDSVNINFFDTHKISWVNSSTKGLSISRNLAIKHATADICLLADDDLVFIEDLAHLVIGEFKKNDSAHIIIFIVDGFSGRRKKNWSKVKKLNYLTSMKVSSVQIAFRRQVIKENNLYFREEFGAGAKYFCGEENIWLWDCLRNGLKIYFAPLRIARLIESESSWFKGYTEWFFISKGAAFAAMSKALSIFLIAQFAVRKHYLWKGEVSFKNSLFWMLKGRSMYLLDQRSVVSRRIQK